MSSHICHTKHPFINYLFGFIYLTFLNQITVPVRSVSRFWHTGCCNLPPLFSGRKYLDTMKLSVEHRVPVTCGIMRSTVFPAKLYRRQEQVSSLCFRYFHHSYFLCFFRMHCYVNNAYPIPSAVYADHLDIKLTQQWNELIQWGMLIKARCSDALDSLWFGVIRISNIYFG